MDAELHCEGIKLFAHVGQPTPESVASGSAPRRGLVLAHGFPTAPRWAESSGRTYPEFADRLAEDTGWAVLAFNFRGTGASEGDFSLAGWQRDLAAAVDYLAREPNIEGIWLAGFRTGGALAICHAAIDERVRGVATFAAPADFDGWVPDPAGLVAEARALGVIRDPAFPTDLSEWAHEFKEARPVDVVDRIPPRPLLIVHGSIDDVVPVADARLLADASGAAELRLIQGGGHRLRHDPRAVAVLLGWLERQAAVS